MNFRILLIFVLLGYGHATYAAERIVGYQVGIVHAMDTKDCPSPTISSHAQSDAVVSRLSDVGALSRLYSSAIWWARSYCNTNNGDALKLRVEFHVDKKLAATFSLTDRKMDSSGDNLWWAERLTLSDLELSSIAASQGPLQDYLQHLADSLLETNKDKRLEAATALLASDWDKLAQTENPTIAFSLARLNMPNIGGSVDDIVGRMGLGSLYFDEQRGNECQHQSDELQRAADLGNAMAAFLVARCAIDLYSLSSGEDLKANIERIYAKNDRSYSKIEAYDRFMLHMAKALNGGFAPAYGVTETLQPYQNEFRRYVGLIADKGMSASIDTLMENGAGGASDNVTGLPGKREIRAALNTQLLLPNCSKAGILFATGSLEHVPIFSEVEAHNGWCSAVTIGVRVNFRFGETQDFQCQPMKKNQFNCSVRYKLDCRIDSFESTTDGNRLICNMLTAGTSAGVAQIRRRADGTLLIERFRANGNKNFLLGVAPEPSTADADTDKNVDTNEKQVGVSNGAPEAEELLAELNRQLLPSSCSQMGTLFPVAANPALGTLPLVDGSRKSWCSTILFKTQVNLRFQEVTALKCQTDIDNRIACSINYTTECELEGALGKSSSKMACRIFKSRSSQAYVKSQRRADGVLQIEQFHTDPKGPFLAGVSP